MEAFLQSDLAKYMLPLMIFISRIIDVSLGTLRIIFVSKGMKLLAPLIGFFEVLIWLLAMGQIMQNLNSVYNYLAYAGGFAAGNYIGIYLEEKLAMGITMIRIITNSKAEELMDYLSSHGFKVTHVPAKSNNRKVEVLFLPTRRKEVDSVIHTAQKFNPKALYTIEDVRHISQDSLPYSLFNYNPRMKASKRLFRFKRKSK